MFKSSLSSCMPVGRNDVPIECANVDMAPSNNTPLNKPLEPDTAFPCTALIAARFSLIAFTVSASGIRGQVASKIKGSNVESRNAMPGSNCPYFLLDCSHKFTACWCNAFATPGCGGVKVSQSNDKVSCSVVVKPFMAIDKRCSNMSHPASPFQVFNSSLVIDNRIWSNMSHPDRPFQLFDSSFNIAANRTLVLSSAVSNRAFLACMAAFFRIASRRATFASWVIFVPCSYTPSVNKLSIPIIVPLGIMMLPRGGPLPGPPPP